MGWNREKSARIFQRPTFIPRRRKSSSSSSAFGAQEVKREATRRGDAAILNSTSTCRCCTRALIRRVASCRGRRVLLLDAVVVVATYTMLYTYPSATLPCYASFAPPRLFRSNGKRGELAPFHIPGEEGQEVRGGNRVSRCSRDVARERISVYISSEIRFTWSAKSAYAKRPTAGEVVSPRRSRSKIAWVVEKSRRFLL